MNIKAKLKRPANLLLILALLQFSGSLIMFISVSWQAGIGLLITTVGTIIGWYIKIIQPTVDLSIPYEMSIAFIIKPDEEIILSETSYKQLVPLICNNINITYSGIGEGLYIIQSNVNTYHLSITSELIKDSAANQNNYRISSLSFTYPHFELRMNGFDFKNKLPELVELVKQFYQESAARLPDIDAEGIITIRRFLASEGLYDVRFRRKLNNLFKAHFHYSIKLSSHREKCDFGRRNTKFVFPLERFPEILSKMADIVWYSEDC